jgi:transcriptional regulator with XRE-family HTH domain
MARAKAGRKQLFRAALALAGITARQWAEREGISESYLSLVLNGKRESVAVTEKIDDFMTEQFGYRPIARAS